MIRKAFIYIAAGILLCSCGTKNVSPVWTAEKANEWFDQHGWVSGCDYIPAYAINQLEMWQADTFSPEDIDRELGWAEDLGFNCMRVFLHHLLWEDDRDGLIERMDRYLDISSSHGIYTMFVFLDDCWNEDYATGKQPEPQRGVHNSGWVKDPGALFYGPSGSGLEYAADTASVARTLEAYVTDVMSHFKDDSRIYAWDLYNEPGGGQDPDRYWERSFPLLKDIFRWARKVNPSQPLTAGVWNARLSQMNLWQIENSDIVTYHTYESIDSHRAMLDTLKSYGKPMVCTEYMARTQNSTFQDIMPLLRRENVGAINWGFVSGKSNTIFDWETMRTPCPTDEPLLWFHDILRSNGTPYSSEEVECIKAVNGKTVPVVPYPAEVVFHNGSINVKGARVVCGRGLSAEEKAIVAQFGNAVSVASGGKYGFVASGGKDGSATIRFIRDSAIEGEGYGIDITKDGITVSSGTYSGTLYAIATLSQMMPAGVCTKTRLGVCTDTPEEVCTKTRPGVCHDTSEGVCAEKLSSDSADWYIPCADIRDYPRFGWRGLELDCSRHFFSTDEIMKILDVMALYKLNRFHWHLTDDQGWRVEIKKYPKLTGVGAWRDGSQVDWDVNHNDGIRYGDFYTQEQIRSIVAYAAERGIEIVPEIDLPAHLLSALAAYPELGCAGGPYKVFTLWDIAPDVLCVGKESSFAFLEGVFDEICELFPGEYVHIGGDECPKGRWHECPACQNRIDELGLKDSEDWTAEHYLQNYVTARVQKMLSDRGKRVIGWDEILEGKLEPGATVMSWRGTEGGKRAAENGFDVIMTPTEYCYLDYCQGADPMREPTGIGHYLPIEKCWSYDPVEGISAEGAGYVLGVQGNLWTEFIARNEHLEYMLLPRLLALSEVQWCLPESKSWARFEYDLKARQIPRLRKMGYTCRDMD